MAEPVNKPQVDVSEGSTAPHRAPSSAPDAPTGGCATGCGGATFRLSLYCAVACAVVVLDQLSKAAARAALVPGQPVTLIPGVMDLSLVYNTGAAFSMGEGAGVLFVLVAAVVCVGAGIFAWRESEAPGPLVAVLACVAGGGVGNAIDRVVAGRVTDFFATTFMDFAVFNVADIFITCGVILALVLWWRWDASRERRA